MAIATRMNTIVKWVGMAPCLCLVACLADTVDDETPQLLQGPPQQISPKQSCITANLIEDGHTTDNTGPAYCASPAPVPDADGNATATAEPEACPNNVAASAFAQCEAEGQGCDPSLLISRDAAFCIASELKLAPGLRAWDAHLVYNSRYKRVLWVVQNLTLDNPGNCEKAGAAVSVDAETGEQVGEGQGWSSIC